MKKICFVVQRYGRGILGGAEMLCAQYVRRLAGRYDIDVATSCAKDYNTWANEYPSGQSEEDGATVYRFRSVQRDAALFERLDAEVYGNPEHSMDTAAAWLREVGPRCPGLLEFIDRNRDNYAAFLFVGYHYYPTTYGLPLVPERAVFLPTAHDEPPLKKCNYFKYLFRIPKAVAYLTEAEKAFVQGYFHNEDVGCAVIGSGVSVPETVDESRVPDGPYILYAGRIDSTKNCGELIENFAWYKEAQPSGLKLVLAGQLMMELPQRDDIACVGFVSEEEKFGLLQNARAFVMPSGHESLSISTLEAMRMETPVLVCSRSAVLKRHVVDSGAGLYYDAREGFAEGLNAILGDEDKARDMGENGRRYVEQNYNWETVVEKLAALIEGGKA